MIQQLTSHEVRYTEKFSASSYLVSVLRALFAHTPLQCII